MEEGKSCGKLDKLPCDRRFVSDRVWNLLRFREREVRTQYGAEVAVSDARDTVSNFDKYCAYPFWD